MTKATTTGVRARHVPQHIAETTAARVTHEIVVTSRLLIYWKKSILDAVASGGDVGTLGTFAEMGKLMFFAGLLAFLFAVGGKSCSIGTDGVQGGAGPSHNGR